MRHWLHDLASELWDATRDQTLPAELSRNHVWITAEGRAILLDEPRPDVHTPAERIPVGDVAGQQKFEKLSFLTGTLRGLLDRPAEVSRGIRAGSLFMLPLYVWIAVVVGRYHDKQWDDPGGIVIVSALVVLGAIALIQLLELPFRSTASHSIFRLAVVNAKGEPAARSHLLVRWAIVWLPLFLPMSFVALLIHRAEGIAFISALVLLLLWVGAAVYAVVHPHRGLHDRLAGTWVVRR
ncbi:MAG: RDD family protein [Planctomycetota bacterium]